MLLGAVLGFLTPVVDRFFDNKDQAEKFKAELSSALIAGEADLRKAQRDIIVAEAQGHSWLQRNWRPLLMLVCIIIVANNYIFAPYMQLFTGESISLTLDQNIWDLMKIGVGGYIAGRTGEKMVKAWGER